jgi:Putative prokaryotic signal transducing protein
VLNDGLAPKGETPMLTMQKTSGAVSKRTRPTMELKLYQLVTVYTVDNFVKAEIIQNALHDEGVRCFLEGENQAGGLTAMEIKIQVPIANADRARKLIESHECSAG